MEETFKRTRTSPRTNVINEVQAIISQVRSEYGTSDISTVLAVLSSEVDKLRAGHPKADKDDTTTGVIKRGGGIHFVGVTGDGKVLYLKRDDEGVYHTPDDEDSRDTLSHIYGPFNTAEGARYAVTHNTYDTRPRVFPAGR